MQEGRLNGIAPNNDGVVTYKKLGFCSFLHLCCCIISVTNLYPLLSLQLAIS